MSKMLEEIRQQPAVLERTLNGALRAVERLRRRLKKRRPNLIVLAARGTSDNAAQFGRYLLEVTTGIPVSLAAPSIFTLYRAPVELKDALVVAISQSGESTDTNLVLERTREAGAHTIGITNSASSTLAKLPEQAFLVRAGKEKSVAATKTYTGQVLILYLLAYALGAKIRLEDLRRLPEWADAALRLESEIAGRAERYRFMERAITVGRGFNYPTALEFALKLKETCYVVAEGFSPADFLHGPIAMVEPSFSLFMFAPNGVIWPSLKEMLEKLERLKAETLVVTDRGNAEARKKARRAICIPANLNHRGPLPQDLYTPIPYVIPAQLFSARLATEKGLDPDRPRTLTKVTQTL
jgi:glucosamine--fructose-6-phosphate aminotransferase (isomerizing)